MTESPKEIPSLYEWAGGLPVFEHLTDIFYSKVLKDELLEPVFRHMSSDHRKHVAHFIAEVFGGPPVYSSEGGSHIGMIVNHLGRGITEEQRARWVELMRETAAEVELPSDPAFKAAFVSYLQWGSKLAVINSAPGVAKPEGEWPMPQWGWCAARGPAKPE